MSLTFCLQFVTWNSTLRKSCFLSHGLCPTLLSYGCDEHHGQKQLEEDRAHFSLQVIVHHQRRPGKEIKAGSWRMVLPTVAWSLLHQLPTKKMPV